MGKRSIGQDLQVRGNLEVTGSTVTLQNGVITRAALAHGPAFSVPGRISGTTGELTDIVAVGGSQFLKTSPGGSALLFDGIEPADFPDGDWVGADSGTDYANASTAMAADSTWYDTGASIALDLGTYLVTTFAQGFLRTTASTAAVTTRLYNVTDSAAVTNSECCIIWDVNATRRAQTGTLSIVLAVGGTKTFRLETSRLAGGTYSVSPTILNDTVGRSGITFVRIA